MIYGFSAASAARGVLRARRGPPYRPHPSVRTIDVAIGARLRQARLIAGATQQELGEALGVSARTIARYETGRRRMSPVRLAAAVRFLGVPLSWLFREDGAPRPC
jgi:DNA-binding XRE family transcriptional regulator